MNNTIPVNINKARYSQDSLGVWWYLMNEARNVRTKAVLGECLLCGNTYLTVPQRFKRTGRQGQFCSRSCGTKALGGHKNKVGLESHLWKGGKRESKGYIEVYQPNHPSLKGTKRMYVREHRLVMENKIGRYLEKWEEVHHLNSVRNDNRPENLELWVKSHPAGSRLNEAVKHCPTCNCNNLN